MVPINFHNFRGSCRLCEKKIRTKAINLNPIPLGEKYNVNKVSNSTRYPIDIYQCSFCKCVQTQDNIDNNLLWGDYTYFSGQTPKIIEHFKDFCKKINKTYSFPENPKILDIGSNDGTLLNQFKEAGWLEIGIDPAETVVDEALKNGVNTILGLFNSSIIEKIETKFQQVDLITAFNVFAHSDEMNEMMTTVTKLLKQDGIFCFEVQYLGAILDKKLLGTIFHEHMIHYSAYTADYFLNLHGFEIKDLEFNNIQHGSVIFHAGKKANKHKRSEYVDKIINEEKSKGILDGSALIDFNNWIDAQRNILKKIKVEWSNNNLEIAGYGAARSGPTLAIQLGLENTIKYLIDDHNMKVNKYSAFESLYVYPSSVLKKSAPDVTIILAWIHYKNIIKNNVEYMANGGKFFILWPNASEVNFYNYKDFF